MHLPLKLKLQIAIHSRCTQENVSVLHQIRRDFFRDIKSAYEENKVVKLIIACFSNKQIQFRREHIRTPNAKNFYFNAVCTQNHFSAIHLCIFSVSWRLFTHQNRAFAFLNAVMRIQITAIRMRWRWRWLFFISTFLLCASLLLPLSMSVFVCLFVYVIRFNLCLFIFISYPNGWRNYVNEPKSSRMKSSIV